MAGIPISFDGNFNGIVNLNFNKQVLYDADFKFSNLNIELLKELNPKWISKVQGTATGNINIKKDKHSISLLIP